MNLYNIECEFEFLQYSPEVLKKTHSLVPDMDKWRQLLLVKLLELKVEKEVSEENSKSIICSS